MKNFGKLKVKSSPLNDFFNFQLIIILASSHRKVNSKFLEN